MQGPLILLVDDYIDAREMYAEFLQLSGFSTLQAPDALEGIAKAALYRPAAIVLDIGLPGIDGFEAARRIKLDPRTAAIPMIALSGCAEYDFKQRARAAGFFASMAKPCAPDKLVLRLREAIASAMASEQQLDAAALAATRVG